VKSAHGRATSALLAVLVAAIAPSHAAAQSANGRDPLARLESSVRYRVEVLIDSARLHGLPTAPLVSKALEGAAKRADGRSIVAEVSRKFRALRDARAALGPKVSTDELSAAADALGAGISQAQLASLARSRSDKILTVPLVVLTDLVTRGVPRDTASATIFQLFQKGAEDGDFLGLWRGVERDIVSGTDPGQALLNRAREIPSRGPPSVVPPASTKRPESPETQ
jgi:hypothetical protein